MLLKQDPCNFHTLTFISEFIILSLYLHFVVPYLNTKLIFAPFLSSLGLISVNFAFPHQSSIHSALVSFLQSTKLFKSEPCWKQIIMTKISPWLFSLRKYHHHLFSFISWPLICKYLFIWLCWILVVTCRIFSCSMRTLSYGTWDLDPWPGIEPQLGSLSHWTIREVPPTFPLVFTVSQPLN